MAMLLSENFESVFMILLKVTGSSGSPNVPLAVPVMGADEICAF